MSAQDIEVVTIIVPNPEYDDSNNAQVVNSNAGFAVRIRNNFRTLSTNNPNRDDPIEGLFYVPTLNPSYDEACADAYALIPKNVTTTANFPAQDYPLVALFPFTTPNCTIAYLEQTRNDTVEGIIVFQPDQNQKPPDASDPSWQLTQDPYWLTNSPYPVYAINALAGNNLLLQLSLYSGNMSSVPNGQQLAQQYDSRNLPRLFAQVDLQNSSYVPSIWIFLIIVLAILLGIVVLASIVMHILQRYQRKDLQRRLERGEVDLESLGIKKMNVPQEKIDEMPKYVFTQGPEAVAGVPVPKSPFKKEISSHPQASFSQTTCPICLDDFVSGETEVRELPCKHIFHPECIDLFLRDNSSLCPMCKTSALPAGYCPVKVTNLMVRRERLMRRMRERHRQATGAAAPPTPRTRLQQASLWVQRRMRVANGIASSPGPSDEEQASRRARRQSAAGPETQAIEMEQGVAPQSPQPTSQVPAAPANVISARRQTMAVPADIASQGAAARRAWRRERLAQQQAQAYDQQAQTVREVDEGRPWWRRILGRVAPGLD